MKEKQVLGRARPSLMLGAAALFLGMGAVYAVRQWRVPRAAAPPRDAAEGGELHFRYVGTGRPARIRPASPVAGQAEAYGRAIPAGDTDQPLVSEGLTDFGDVAQNQMPGKPQHLRLDPRDALEEPRRREFDALVKRGEQGR
jgi:hypothetical protein